MRFKRYGRPEAFEWTGRKLASFQKKPEREQRRTQARYPLLASVLPAPAAVDVDLEAQRRQKSSDDMERTLRDLSARCWRNARREYFAASDETRARIRAEWAAWRGPTTAFYFGYVVDVQTGAYKRRAAASREKEAKIRAALRAGRHAQLSFGLA